MHRRLALALATAILLAVAALALHGALGSSPRHAPTAPTLILAAPAGPAITIGRHPIGVSIEYPLLAHDLGSGRCPPAAFVRALTALGAPTLRIGGDSQDQTAPAGAPAHPGVSDLQGGFWSQVGCLERETRIPIVVGLNLASGETAWAAELAASARAAIPAARLSFALGNEPDIYGAPVKWWNGQALVSAPMLWPTYLARATSIALALGGGSALEGPDFASGRWIALVPALAKTLHLRTVDAHFYPLDGCRDPASATSAALLSRAVQTKLDERVRLARDARAAGLSAVISETNSVSCGGLAGVSDAPSSAVWAVRTILTALRDGFGSVRFHASCSSYDPFVVAGATLVERPLYLGLRAIAGLLTPGELLQAIPNAAALDAVAISRSGGERTVVLSNYSSQARRVALAATARVRVLRVEARAPVVTAATVAPSRRRVLVELPANSVDAITLAPSA